MPTGYLVVEWNDGEDMNWSSQHDALEEATDAAHERNNIENPPDFICIIPTYLFIDNCK